MEKNELQDLIINIKEIKNNNSEDFKKLQYIVEGVLLAQKTIGSVEKNQYKAISG